MAKVQIELKGFKVDSAIEEAIDKLERKVMTLERKVATRDRRIAKLTERYDMGKVQREKVLLAADVLHDALHDSHWVDYDQEAVF